MVIIDAPPLLAVTDALVLSQIVDGVILVINTGSTRNGEVVQAKAQLDQVGARIIGVVLNRVPTGRGRYSYYYYQHYHYDSPKTESRARFRLRRSSAAADSTPVAGSLPKP